MPTQIKDFRAKYKLTQSQLAEKLPVRLGTLQAWEAGRFDPPPYLYRAFEHLEKELKKVRESPS